MNPEAVRLNNLAIEYHAQGRFNESDVTHKQCLALLESAGRDEPSAIAQSLANRAALYRTMLEYPEAERVFQLAIRVWDRYGWPDFGSASEMLWADVLESNGLLRSFGREVQRMRKGVTPSLNGARRRHPRRLRRRHPAQGLRFSETSRAERDLRPRRQDPRHR